jgi:acetyltransferase-like isoleucine patch superfamily enzyme
MGPNLLVGGRKISGRVIGTYCLGFFDAAITSIHVKTGTSTLDLIRLLKRRIKSIVFQKIKILNTKYPQYEIGRHTYGNPEIRTWNEGATLKIGAFCSIADGVKIFLGGEHRVDWTTTYPFTALWEDARHIIGHPKTKGDVVIGNDVWIGSEAVIMSGVHIGDGAVVGARAVVSKDIKPYAVYAGNPARKVRNRFNDTTTEQLLTLEWWNFDDSEIIQMLPLMLSKDIDKFIREANIIKKSKIRH